MVLRDSHVELGVTRVAVHLVGIRFIPFVMREVRLRKRHEHSHVVGGFQDLLEAQMAAGRLHEVVTKEPVDTAKGAIPLQISMGVASLNNSDDMEKLLIKTDQALYEAKKSGRNQVIVYDTNVHKQKTIES